MKKLIEVSDEDLKRGIYLLEVPTFLPHISTIIGYHRLSVCYKKEDGCLQEYTGTPLHPSGKEIKGSFLIKNNELKNIIRNILIKLKEKDFGLMNQERTLPTLFMFYLFEKGLLNIFKELR